MLSADESSSRPRWSTLIRGPLLKEAHSLPIGVVKGEGIGPLLNAIALQVLEAVGSCCGTPFDVRIAEPFTVDPSAERLPLELVTDAPLGGHGRVMGST